jgi:YEATS domain-containing protein 4
MTIMKTNHHGRLENTTTCLPIAYGSVAFYLGSKADEYHTHRWTLYVRSPDQTFDLGLAISKVVFQLHPSFPQPTRELVEPPFEVTETGWGEFEASIRIVWRDDADERSTILTHGIRLYPNRTPTTGAGPSACMDTTVPGGSRCAAESSTFVISTSSSSSSSSSSF